MRVQRSQVDLDQALARWMEFRSAAARRNQWRQNGHPDVTCKDVIGAERRLVGQPQSNRSE
jgi:hypothetical protein